MSFQTSATDPGDTTAKIRALNDALRQGQVQHGMIVVTSGISAMGEAFVVEAMRQVAGFDAFDCANDP